MSLTTEIPLQDGACTLVQGYIDNRSADTLFTILRQSLCWTQPEVFIFGRRMRSPRLSAWYGDADAVYRYSGIENRPLPWTPELINIRQRLLDSHGVNFNSVLANLYRNGGDAMGWHSDDEPELGTQPVIASISLGASRRFLMRHRKDQSRKTIQLQLEHGTLLLMGDDTQNNWKHAIPRTSKTVGERMNLTFRYVTPRPGSPIESNRSGQGL